MRDGLSFAYKGIHRGARDMRWKLIEYLVDGKRRTQLFDLDADPWETKDLSNDAAHSKEIERLRAWLLDRCRELDDEDGVRMLSA